MRGLCDCETIKEFWKFVIDLINVNINNYRYTYFENDGNLSMNEKQIVILFFKCYVDCIEKKMLYKI